MNPDNDKPEPAAWINFNAATGKSSVSYFCESELGSIPLWEDPPIKRKPLSDDTLRQCAQAMDAEPLSEGWTELIKFARAIERSHGINEL
jgi:hypothetical protein